MRHDDSGARGAGGADNGAGVVDDEAVRLAVVEAGAAPLAAELFAGVERVVLTRSELRPEVPFAGALFDLLGGLAGRGLIGLVVPGAWRDECAGSRSATPPPPAVPRLPSPLPAAADVLVVRDHVNLALRGPLTGRWPADVPRTFPCMTGIYQPAAARAAAGAPVYSEDVVTAGVRDASRLTPFERRALAEAGAEAYSDCLVPAVVAAAFYGLKVAACLLVQAARERE